MKIYLLFLVIASILVGSEADLPKVDSETAIENLTKKEFISFVSKSPEFDIPEFKHKLNGKRTINL